MDNWDIIRRIKPVKTKQAADAVESEVVPYIEGTVTALERSDLTKIGLSAFAYHDKLVSVDCPNVTELGKQAFQDCTSLTNVNLPNVILIGERAFLGCSALSNLSVPNATTIADRAFGETSGGALSLTFPKATAISGGAFYKNTRITSVTLPMATTVGSYAFENCDNLTTVDFGASPTLSSYVFYDSRNLTAVIIRGNRVAPYNSDAFFGTPIYGSSPTGFIYVPSNLVDSYKSSWNAATIKSISELPTGVI